MKKVREYASAPHNGSTRKSLLQRVNSVRARRAVVLVAVATMAWVGTASRAVTPQAKSGTEHSKPARAPVGNMENGKRLFVKYGCYECHGREAQGSTGTGPRLGPDPAPLSALVSYVRNPTGEMPPYTEKVVSDQDLADIYAFLESLPHPPDAKSIPLLK
jgi:mono/diheme cytochrome c family protein